MIPIVPTDNLAGILSALPGVLVLAASLIIGELGISYAITRIKWEQQYRWPLALGVGILAILHAWMVLPSLGLRPSHLIVLGGIVLAGLVAARYELWLVYPLERRIYTLGQRLMPPLGWVEPAYQDKRQNLSTSDQIVGLFSRPLVLPLVIFGLLGGIVSGLHSTAVLQMLPSSLRSMVLSLPPSDAILFGIVGIGGGAMLGVLIANHRLQEAIAHMDPPPKHGDLVSSSRVAAADTSMGRPDEPLKPPGGFTGGYRLIRLPDNAPKSIDENSGSSEGSDSSHSSISSTDAGKAIATRHSGEVVASLTFEYIIDAETETKSDDQTETIRFNQFSVRDDCLSARYGPNLVEHTMWRLDVDHYIASVDNPYDYQALYELGFAYTGKTTDAGVELGRPGPVLAENKSLDEVRAATSLGRGAAEAIGDAASIDRSPQTYRTGLQSFLEEDDLAASLSDDARSFIDQHLELDPPTYRSYSQKYYHRRAKKSDSAGSGTKYDAGSRTTLSKTPSAASAAGGKDSNNGMRVNQLPNDEHPLAKQFTEEQLARGHYDWEYSDVRFDDIGGYYEVKQALVDEIIEPLHASAEGDDRFERFGIEPEQGILFYGPPGTGKTMFARALAGQLGVPFVELSPADVTSKWINEGPQLINRLFAEADRLGPCMIFLDEAEHLFGARDTGGRSTHAEDRKITSEFLVHLTDEDRDAIVVSATNRPGDIDPAILRPGRLSTHYKVGLPDEEARQAILATHLDDVPSALTADDRAALASHTRRFSGADLEELVDQAKRSAAKRDAEAVTLDDFPSFDELDAIVTDLEAADDVDALPDPDEESTRADLDTVDETDENDDSDTTDEDDTPVGFQ